MQLLVGNFKQEREKKKYLLWRWTIQGTIRVHTAVPMISIDLHNCLLQALHRLPRRRGSGWCAAPLPPPVSLLALILTVIDLIHSLRLNSYILQQTHRSTQRGKHTNWVQSAAIIRFYTCAGESAGFPSLICLLLLNFELNCPFIRLRGGVEAWREWKSAF